VKNLIDLRRKLRERFSVSVPLKPGNCCRFNDDVFPARKVNIEGEWLTRSSVSKVCRRAYESFAASPQAHRPHKPYSK
jgi:hypothetical protein